MIAAKESAISIPYLSNSRNVSLLRDIGLTRSTPYSPIPSRKPLELRKKVLLNF
jgi:hypothetical protein